MGVLSHSPYQAESKEECGLGNMNQYSLVTMLFRLYSLRPIRVCPCLSIQNRLIDLLRIRRKAHDTIGRLDPSVPQTPAINSLNRKTNTRVCQQNRFLLPSTLHTIPHTSPHFPLELFPVFPPELAGVDVGSTLIVGASEHAND
jgi:hypothetical protein